MSKPKWSEAIRDAQRKINKAENELLAALLLRCSFEDSGGARCTADATPLNHIHKYDFKDLPGYSPEDKMW